MIILGVVGGIASGKSFVSNSLQQLGASVLDADRMGHLVLLEPEVQDALLKRWGAEILASDGRIDRKAIARIVFDPSERGIHALRFLEQLTHPRIGRLLDERLEQLRQLNRFPIVVLDAPVMFKAGWDRKCDRIVFVEAPEELRLKRATLRGWTEADFRDRERRQESMEQKRQRADFVIDNSGTPQQTLQQVRVLWDKLLSPTEPAAR
jgi:dephospho-CoA kinase